MPELPEVQTLVRHLSPGFVGRRLERIWCNWPRMLTPSLPRMQSRLEGATLERLWRRAKFLVWDFGAAGSLLIHLRMSGRPHTVPAARPPANAHVHFVLEFQGQAMHLEDTRKFARAVWTGDVAAATRGLGVEPLGPQFTVDWLAAGLRDCSRQLKPALLDQSFIAGLGNIYCDEALHHAGLHPLRRTDRLSRSEAAALHAAIRHVLETGIAHNGASIDWVYPDGQMQNFFHAYGRAGQPCRRCGAAIRRLVVAQRGTHICPRCQPAPRRRSSRQDEAARR